MTAKQLKQTAQTIIKHKAVYQFTPLELDMFCDQLCKEQREICYENGVADCFDGEAWIDKDSIINAPIPEL